MKSKRGTVWINLGLLLLAAALFLTVYNRMVSYEAGETSRQVIEQLCETLPTESAAETEAPAIPEYLLDAGREMPVQTIGGKDYIGVLTIPSLERETLEPTDLEGMEAGDWDMTLYTCTVGGQSRVTVRFVREEP